MKKDKIMGTKRWIYWVSIGTTLILLYKFLDNFSGIGSWLANFFSVLAPFIVAILISYILYNPCAKIEKKIKKKIKHARLVSIVIVYIIFVISMFFLLKFIIPTVFSGIVDLINNVQNYYNSITTNEIDATWTPFIKTNILKPAVDYIQQIDFKDIITPEKILEYVSSAMGILKIILNIFIAFICSIYILLERESIIKFIDKLANASMNKKGYNKFNRYFSKGNRIFFDFISSQVVDAVVVSIMMSTILAILKVKYAVMLGVIIGLFNLIPYFGAIFAVIIAGLVTVLTGGWKQALIMTIIVIIIQQVDANIINPRITGSKLNISPLLVIFSVTVGGAYFGVIGMFLGVPVAVLIKLMIEDYINSKKEANSEDVK